MTKWSYEVDCWGGGNNERQCYTDRLQNLRVKDGILSIIARHEDHVGQAYPPRLWRKPGDITERAAKPFTSSRIRTLGKGEWRYGRIEVRAKLPGGQGVWPAIWMLPSDYTSETGATAGEIDIMEAANIGTECKDCDDGKENRIYGTLHYKRDLPNIKSSGTTTSTSSPAEEFHTYAIEWSSKEISWFIDGETYLTQTLSPWAKDLPANAVPLTPFDQRFHLIMNVAIGGSFAEKRNDGGVSLEGYPKSMDIDWVRVYQ